MSQENVEAVRRAFELVTTWTEDFDDFEQETEAIIDADNDRVVAITRNHGTGKGSGAPVAASTRGSWRLPARS